MFNNINIKQQYLQVQCDEARSRPEEQKIVAGRSTNAIVDGNLASCVEHKYSKETFSLLAFFFQVHVMARILATKVSPLTHVYWERGGTYKCSYWCCLKMCHKTCVALFRVWHYYLSQLCVNFCIDENNWTTIWYYEDYW